MRLNLLAGIIFFPTMALAAPSVTLVTGTIADDQVLVVRGTSFGSNPLHTEWLGGKTGVVESRATGTAFLGTPRAGWSEDSSLNESRLDSRQVYSGTRSLVFDPALSRWHDGRFGLIYNTGSNFSELYSSYMAYFDDGGAGSGQWKMIRWCFTNSVTDDAVPNAYLANWAGGPGDFFYVQGGTGATNVNWLSTPLPLTNSWYRVETYLRPASVPTASDGEFWVRITNTATHVSNIQKFSNLKTYSNSETNRYRYIVFQNYMGNGSYNNQTKVWMDDVYISQSQARVELCNASTWAACTKRDIQPVTSWNGSQITVKLNKGGMSDLSTTYLYVVDSTGSANADGYPLSNAAGGAEVSPPSPPSDFQVTPL